MSRVDITIADSTERHILKVRISAILSPSELIDGLEARIQVEGRRMENNRRESLKVFRLQPHDPRFSPENHPAQAGGRGQFKPDR